MNRKGKETRDQIANICWIIKKAEFQKNIHICSVDCFCFVDYTKAIFSFCESTVGFCFVFTMRLAHETCT